MTTETEGFHVIPFIGGHWDGLALLCPMGVDPPEWVGVENPKASTEHCTDDTDPNVMYYLVGDDNRSYQQIQLPNP